MPQALSEVTYASSVLQRLADDFAGALPSDTGIFSKPVANNTVPALLSQEGPLAATVEAESVATQAGDALASWLGGRRLGQIGAEREVKRECEMLAGGKTEKAAGGNEEDNEDAFAALRGSWSRRAGHG